MQQEDLDSGKIRDVLADDAVPLCPDCLEPLEPSMYYCQNCGSNEAINPLAAYLPYIRIRFYTGMYGKLWRKCWHAQTPCCLRSLYIGVAFLFYPLISIIGFPFIFSEKIQNDRVKQVYNVFWYLVGGSIVTAIILYRFVLMVRLMSN